MRTTPILSIARPLLAATAILALAACAAQPPRPALRTPLPSGWGNAGGWARMASPPPQHAWWRVFGDARLDALAPQVGARNAQLAAQLAVYEQARAALRQAGAALWPTASATLGATRQKVGATGNFAGQVGNDVAASAAASWAPDLWGKVRLQVRASGDAARADAATLRGMRLSLQAQLAQAVLQLHVADAQIVLARRIADADAQSLRLTQRRFAAGVVTAADVAAARTLQLQSRTALTDLQVGRAQLVDAIAVLVGKPASNFHLAAEPQLPDVPRVPPGLPSALLQRRPDLIAAAAQVDAANAQIGIAERAWFPDLTLGVQGGAQALTAAGLFSAPVLTWSLGPQLAATLFDGGARAAQLAASRAAYRGSVANYRQAVLVALQQVEDQLAAQRLLALEQRQQTAVVGAAEVSLRLAQDQYRAGTAPYLNVLSASNVAAQARVALLTLQQRRYVAAVSLVQALGGGWGEVSRGAAAH